VGSHLLTNAFASDRVSDLDAQERHVKNLLQVMPVQKNGWTEETDIQTLFFRLTIDSSTEFLFGETVDSQLAAASSRTRTGNIKKPKDEVAFSKNFDEATMHMAHRFRLGDLYWTHNPKSYVENNKIINDFISRKSRL